MRTVIGEKNLPGKVSWVESYKDQYLPRLCFQFKYMRCQREKSYINLLADGKLLRWVQKKED